MESTKRLREKVLLSRTIMLGFAIFAIIIAITTEIEGVGFFIIISLMLGYILAKIWQKIDPVAKEDFTNDPHEIKSAKDDLIM